MTPAKAKTRGRSSRPLNNRRGLTIESRFYMLLDRLPFRPSPTLIVTVIAAMFLLFATTCFAATLFGSASDKLTDAEETAAENTAYYDAETTASEILAILADDDGASLTDENGELTYVLTPTKGSQDQSPAAEITISRNGGNFSFDVPIFDSAAGTDSDSDADFYAKKSLHVIARITKGKVDILEWYVEQ